MLSDLSMLYDIKHVSKNCLPINLPNGSSVLVKHVGKYNLTSDIVLNNVWHVPDFKFNLLSMSKLSTENDCIVKFLKHSCVIQEYFMGKILGIGKTINGLYCFSTSQGW